MKPSVVNSRIMKKYTIRDTYKHMIELYEVKAESSELALDKYVTRLAGSLEPLESAYDPDVEDGVEVLTYNYL